jgi:hypothetical protein
MSATHSFPLSIDYEPIVKSIKNSVENAIKPVLNTEAQKSEVFAKMMILFRELPEYQELLLEVRRLQKKCEQLEKDNVYDEADYEEVKLEVKERNNIWMAPYSPPVNAVANTVFNSRTETDFGIDKIWETRAKSALDELTSLRNKYKHYANDVNLTTIVNLLGGSESHQCKLEPTFEIKKVEDSDFETEEEADVENADSEIDTQEQHSDVEEDVEQSDEEEEEVEEIEQSDEEEEVEEADQSEEEEEVEEVEQSEEEEEVEQSDEEEEEVEEVEQSDEEEEEVEEVEQSDEEEEEEEVEEITIGKDKYYLDSEGTIYECYPDGSVGDEIGKYVNGTPIFSPDADV